LLGKKIIRRKKEPFFETGGKVSAQSRSNVWEPGVNPGRLRHCNGYKLPMPPTKIGKAGVRFEAEVRIPVWLRSSAPSVSGRFSAKRRMRPAARTVFARIS